jgi:hypothetical protein
MSSWSALVQITSFTDFFNISNADLMINREITAHRYHSKLNHQIMLIIAATRVDKDKKESLIASIPLATRLHEFNLSHCFFTYLHKNIFVKIAATITIKVYIEYVAFSAWIIFKTDSFSATSPATSTIIAMTSAEKYSILPCP